jgi:hypothetical protein
MTTILGELFKAAKGIGKEAGNQIFGKPKKQKKDRPYSVHVHYHFYREKKKPR